ncbi:uncharacterized protein MKZ38_008789 [Zalerion maritima]|uniref:ATP synthase F(0) complex subunit e, mitochondrial n=1 Tax=Zalerion maritima TaxID=339359 RepID=A0AAD5WTU4_9PEZI|nr:uncharacterized protein MKZ38_008789 [Zalerion maritima]
MASTGVNVLRWTALGLGVFYGFSHQRSIYKHSKAEATKAEYEHKQSLIAKAKAEYAKKHAPLSSGSDGIIRDPEDPKFDLESVLKDYAAKNP